MRGRGVEIGVLVAALALGVFAGLEPLWAALGLSAVAFMALLNRTYKKFIRGRTVNAAPWSPVLLAFPLVCSLRAVNSTLALVGMAGLLVVVLLRKPLAGSEYAKKFPIALIGLALLMVAVRPTSPLAGAFTVLAFLTLVCAVKRTTRHSAVTSLIDGVGLYLIANVVGYHVLHMKSSGASLRTGGLEAADGSVRVLYPLSTSLNLTPIMAAVFLSAALLLMERGGKRLFRLIASAAAVIVLVSAGSRTALVVAVLIAVASLLVSRLVRGLALPVTLGSLAFVFAYPALSRPVITPLITAMTGAIPGLSRGGSGSSDASLNGREAIWFQSSRFWAERTSDWGKFFGYGSQGQYESGASRTYAHIFGSSVRNPYMTSTHNSLLQQLFDAGVIGAAFWVIAVVACVALWVRCSRTHEPYTAAALAASISLVVSSVTEVSLAPGVAQETLLVFIGLLLAACSGKLDEVQTDNQLDDSSSGVLPVRLVTSYRLPERGVVGQASSARLRR
jgi:hypothetical protein